MNIREADKALGEVFHLVERNTVMTKDLDEAFSMIHYTLDKIEEKESSLQQEGSPNCDENVTLSKNMMMKILQYLSLDHQCKVVPTEFCNSHVECAGCNIAKEQSTLLNDIVKEFTGI